MIWPRLGFRASLEKDIATSFPYFPWQCSSVTVSGALKSHSSPYGWELRKAHLKARLKEAKE
jgi:hypothetical protein